MSNNSQCIFYIAQNTILVISKHLWDLWSRIITEWYGMKWRQNPARAEKGKAVHENAGLFWFVRNCIKEEVLVSQFAHHSYKNSRRRRRGRGSLSGSSCWTSVLFAALGVELEQQAEGGEAEQQGLREPHAASGHAVNALVSGKEEWAHTYYTFTNKKYCVRQRGSAYVFILFVYHL